MKIIIKANVAPLENYKIYVDDKIITKRRGTKPIEFDIESNNKDRVLQLKGLNGKSELIIIKSDIDVVEYIFEANLLKTAKVGYFKLASTKINNENNNDNKVKESEKQTDDSNAVEEKSTSGGGIFSVIFVLILIGGSIWWIWYNYYTSPEHELEAESGAVTYITNKTYLYSEPTKSQLSCDARGKSGDITLVKCTTTLDEVIEEFGSDTIWYGYLPTASGYSGYGFADKSKDEVIRTLNSEE